jgi:hypothetical protein
MPWTVTPSVGDMITDVPDGVFDPDDGAEEGIIGAAKVAPAPINATMTGITTACKETPLARS